MQLRLRTVIALFQVSLLFPALSPAQEGGLMLTQFSESRQSEDQNWSICQDGHNIMLFANRRGVAIYDGYTWNLKRLPVIPYTMVYNANDDKVYIGGEDGYGYMARNEKGLYDYTPIDPDPSFSGVVTGILFTDSTLWVLTSNCIAGHSMKTLEQTHFLTSLQEAPFVSMFAAPSGLFVSLYSEGLHSLKGETLVPLITGYMTAVDDILFTLPYDARQVMIGLSSGAIELFDGVEFKNWELDDGGYLEKNGLAGGHIVNDSILLFSTIEGGVVVAGKNSREIYHLINYQSGLPDNEVYAIGSDNNMGLWISHEFGLTRADLGLPVRNFGVYPGLNGNLISSIWYKGKLYVGTSDGLFVLEEVKEYSEVEVLKRVRSTRKPSPASESTASDSKLTDDHTADTEQRISVFNRIFGKKELSAPVVVPEKTTTATKPAEKPEYVYVRQTESVLQSINHKFVRVPLIVEKCKQLVGTPYGLLVCTNLGLYVVNEGNTTAIETDIYINRVGPAMPDGSHLVVTNSGYFSLSYIENKWKVTSPGLDIDRTLYSVASDNDGNIWMGGDNALLCLRNGNGEEKKVDEYAAPSQYIQRYRVEFLRDTLFVFISSGIFFYDQASDDLLKLNRYTTNSNQELSYIFTENGRPWIIQGQNTIFFGEDAGWTQEKQSLLRLFDGITSITSYGNMVWITDNTNRLYRIDSRPSDRTHLGLNVYIGRNSDIDEPFFDLDIAPFERGHSEINFKLISPYYGSQKSVQYRYRLSGVSEKWSEWSSTPTITKYLKPGNYTLSVMSSAAGGITSKERSIQFRIRPTFIKTIPFYVIVSILLLAAINLYVRMRERKLLNDKKILEDKVFERTAEIEAQKKEITSSIEYASRIQQAMLSESNILENAFSDHFIIYRPKNIVSGDFYWIASEGGRVFITAADCTGHGVPGAFMSMLGISSLNDIINTDTKLSASEVLDRLRERIMRSLKQTGRQGEATDGIDMALCIFDKKSNIIEFAGAYNTMVHFRGPKITEHCGNRMPIGIYHGKSVPFDNHIVKVNKGDVIYLFTDGFADQFGGPRETKYKTKNLKLLLSSVKDNPMNDQLLQLNEEFDRWRGSQEQTDDVTMIGIRI